jgi:deoxyribodipyrimidine photolyase-related protein
MTAALVFPHQLYKEIVFSKKVEISIIEDSLFFTHYSFHKQKILLHRASMKYYEAYLKKLGYQTRYWEAASNTSVTNVISQLAATGITTLEYIDPTDYLLERRIRLQAKKSSLECYQFSSPNFLLRLNEFEHLQEKGGKYLMASFYIKQRKKFSVLVTKDGEPLGGQWSFDEDNRKKVPKGLKSPVTPFFKSSNYKLEASDYVTTHFSDNPGNSLEFNYPITHAQAEEALELFLVDRMNKFGDYEDAIVKNEHFLFHSVLSPAINIGLLSPQQIIDTTLKLHTRYSFPLNSLEGFIRQILGWREFVRRVYIQQGVPQRTSNHFGFTRKIPKSFWGGETGVEPIDTTIKKVLQTGYCHHIERLMVLGNFMLLCEFDPDEVYRWFMELFVDAYDWVMVPNVYGMSQYADGGLMTTKPYLSGSNYILKMSDYQMGPWCETWDALYWRFIHKQYDQLKTNPRMSMMTSMMKKMDENKLLNHLEKADAFLQKLDTRN